MQFSFHIDFSSVTSKKYCYCLCVNFRIPKARGTVSASTLLLLILRIQNQLTR